MKWNGLYDLPKYLYEYFSNEKGNFAYLYEHFKQPYLMPKCDEHLKKNYVWKRVV